MITRRFFLGLIGISAFPFSSIVLANQTSDSYKRIQGRGSPGLYNFFSYACGHCYRFHSSSVELKQKLLAKGYHLYDVPVMLDPSHVIISQTYFALDRLGKVEELHEELWHWFLYVEHKWTTTEDVNKDIIAWVKDRGIAEETWVTALHHKDTLAKVEWAQKLAADYQLDGTPAIGVNGKYLTSPSMAGSNEKCVELVLELADKK